MNPSAMSLQSFSLFYITAKSEKQALEIANAVVQEKLAACANILPQMTSVYRWEEKLTVDQECVLLLKAPAANRAKIQARVKELHSYEIPCVMELPIHSINSEYGAWLKQETPSD